MALSDGVLSAMAGLNGPLTEVRLAVDRVVAAQQPGASLLTKEEALQSLEATTQAWLDASETAESALNPYIPGDEPEQVTDQSEDAADAVERLGGISLLHLAVASDLAKLAPIDALSDGDPVRDAEPVPETARPSAIEAVAGGEPDQGGVLEAIVASPQDDKDEEREKQHERDEPLGAAVSPNARLAVSVLTELVDNAGNGVYKVLAGAAPPSHFVFNAIQPGLEAGLAVAPDAVADAIRGAVRSIVRLAKWVFRRAYDVFNIVMRGNSNVVASLLDESKGRATELVLGRPVRAIVAKMLSETRCRTVIKQRALRHLKNGTPLDNMKELRKILRHNKRWVARPVPVAARTLHPLYSVPIGPVPAAPIAACLLLGWTMLFTGDQLDSPGALFPNFWCPGVLGLA